MSPTTTGSVLATTKLEITTEIDTTTQIKTSLSTKHVTTISQNTMSGAQGTLFSFFEIIIKDVFYFVYIILYK